MFRPGPGQRSSTLTFSAAIETIARPREPGRAADGVARPTGWRANHGGWPMRENVLQAVGHTPLVRLRRLAEGVRAAVCVKVESLNPGGSVKDRVGVAMV